MKKKKKRGKIVLAAAGCTILFILFFPKFVEGPMRFSLEWERPVSGPVVPAAVENSESIIPFSTETYFGYITSGGEIISREPIFYNVAKNRDYYINHSEITENLVVKNPEGQIITGIHTSGYPFIRRNRLFVIDKDRCGISEWDETGTLKWSRRFSSMITSFDCGVSKSLIGFINGEIVFLHDNGKTFYKDIPTGSRVRIVYGVAIDPGEEQFAVILGIDPQRLVVFTKSEEVFRPLFSRNVESEYRREVFISYNGSNSLSFEQPGELVFMDVRRRRSFSFPVDGTPVSVELDKGRKTVFITLRTAQSGRLDLYTTRGLFLASFFVPLSSGIELDHESIYFTSRDIIRRVNIVGGGNDE